jgi:5'-3' exonuclease
VALPDILRRASSVSVRGVPRPLLAVDAPSMLFRAFYALPKSIKGPDGNPVNALLGTANLILREVETHDPRAVVLCFGPDAAAYRLELFPAYHADREAAFPDELRPQWEDSADFFGAFGWKIATSETFEADDLLGSLAEKERRAGGRSLLMTGDRDMFQCASGSTKVLYVSTGRQGGQPMGPAEVKERYGIPPKLVPDLIALRGDPSDGIPGAKGVGEKTAVELLRKHGPLEKVLDAAIREVRPALRIALVGDRDQLLVFKDVATLRTAKVSRPRDKRTDYRGAAKAARERGMNRLAERLLDKARS